MLIYFLGLSKVKSTYKCTICPGDKSFESNTLLVKHLLNHNNVDKEDRTPQKSDQPSSCNHESKICICSFLINNAL